MLRPLTIKEHCPPRWTKYFALFDAAGIVMHLRVSRVLRARPAFEVEEMWSGYSHLKSMRNEVGEIIADSCRWPNALFIPNDECAIIMPGDMEMSGETALTRVAEHVHCDTLALEHIWVKTFAVLLESLKEYGDGIRVK